MIELNPMNIMIGVGAILLLSYLGGQLFSRMIGKSAHDKADAILQEAKETVREMEIEAYTADLVVAFTAYWPGRLTFTKFSE